MTRVVVTSATVEDVDAMAAAWVALAEEQRQHGSHLLSGPNRGAVRDDLSRRAVLDEVLVARLAPDGTDPGDALASADLSVPGDTLDGETLPASFLGFVSFGLEVDGFERDVERGVVHNLYVRRGARSAGVGSVLLSTAEDELQAAGAERVCLEALADNESARAFYREAGYGEHRVGLEKRLE